MPPHIRTEQDTRREKVDPRLREAGWQVTATGPHATLPEGCALCEYPTANGPADYALCLGGRVAAIVEAKKLTLGPQGVLTQAERYARGLPGNGPDYGGLFTPFLYSTNGQVIWFHDVRRPLNRSREVAGFHTPAALLELLERDFDAGCESLRMTANVHPRLRPYQIEANQAVEAAIAAGQRQMLLAMATGTGKTFTMVNQVYRLMKSGAAKRILFLVDRRALAAQAVQAFDAFDAEPNLKFSSIYEVFSQRFHRDDLGDSGRFDPAVLPGHYLTSPHAGAAFVYVCTIQRMSMNLFGPAGALPLGEDEPDEDARQLDIPIHAFDVVIADECHRGYTAQEASLWRATLQHFDAVQIGLTATPAAHTMAYFKDIVFRYSYEQAVREGYLVDYDVVKLKSNVRMNGVFLQEGAEVGVVDTETGAQAMDVLEDQRSFEASDVEKRVTSPDSNKKIMEEVAKYATEHEERYGRSPKILIFAANDVPHTSHADQLVVIARDVFRRGESFVQKITGRVDRPLQRIREFRNRPEPGIAVTVDMLTTGVDIPDLEFLVFLRTVKSRILFEQMLGRGTRKGEKFADKSHFTVFDCFDGTLLQYFRDATGMTAEPPDRPGKSIVAIIEEIWQNKDRSYNIRLLVKRLQRIDKEMSGDARDRFSAFIPDGDLCRYAAALPGRLAADFVGAIALLRDPAFQHLLLNYPRPWRPFIIDYTTKDDVTSERLIRDLLGNAYRPEDYITAFSRYVQDNATEIQAIGALLDRPQEWSAGALDELRRKLAADQRFTEENLQSAHQIKYHKAMVDIISMVQRAAREDAPLLTAGERAARAVERVTAGRVFTPEQQAWMDRIRNHLQLNLSLDQADFDDLQIFARAGGRVAARTALGDLGSLVHQLNEAMAA